MPGPTPRAPVNRRAIPLREIGIRLLNRNPRNAMLTTEAGGGSIQWSSCAPQTIKPTRPEEPRQPQYIFITAITVIRVPNYATFSNPCK